MDRLLPSCLPVVLTSERPLSPTPPGKGPQKPVFVAFFIWYIFENVSERCRLVIAPYLWGSDRHLSPCALTFVSIGTLTVFKAAARVTVSDSTAGSTSASPPLWHSPGQRSDSFRACCSWCWSDSGTPLSFMSIWEHVLARDVWGFLVLGTKRLHRNSTVGSR